MSEIKVAWATLVKDSWWSWWFVSPEKTINNNVFVTSGYFVFWLRLGKYPCANIIFCFYCQKQPFCVCSVCFCSFVYSCSSLAIFGHCFVWKLSKKNLNNSMMIKNLFMCVWCGEELQRLKLNQTKTQGSAALLTLKRILILFICFTWSLFLF